MMNIRIKHKTLAAAFACVLIAVLLAASTAHVQKYRFRPYLHDPLYLPSGKFLGELALGYEEMVADLVWFSAIQYYGDFRKGNHDLRYFEGLIDIVTTLDPHFIFAYIFGGMVVAEDIEQFPRGIAILKRGIANNPTSWELPFEVGFLNFVNRRDMSAAARYFDLASKMPGTPERAKRFAAYVYSKAGSIELSIRIWEEYKELTENPWLKELADRYMQELEAQLENRDRGRVPDVH